jgi:hypothetical protein
MCTIIPETEQKLKALLGKQVLFNIDWESFKPAGTYGGGWLVGWLVGWCCVCLLATVMRCLVAR